MQFLSPHLLQIVLVFNDAKHSLLRSKDILACQKSDGYWKQFTENAEC
jgi:hypothetical protein